MQRREEEDREQVRTFTFTTNFTNNCNDIKDSKDLAKVAQILQSVQDSMQGMPQVKLPDFLGFNMLNNINTNQNIKVNFNNKNEVDLSKSIHQLTKNILAKCGIPCGNDIDIEYDMDTTNDENIALSMAREEEAALTASRQRRRNKKKPPEPSPVILSEHQPLNNTQAHGQGQQPQPKKVLRGRLSNRPQD